VYSLSCKATFDDRTLKDKLRRGNIESLSHAGGAVRWAVRQSIHKRKKPSTPGSPPHTQTMRLPQSVLYAVERNREFAVVGPSSHFGRKIHKVAALHEFSGFDGAYRNPRRRIRKLGSAGEIEIVAGQRRRRGRFAKQRGTVSLKNTRRGTVRVRFAKLRTASQVRRANQINEELYGPLKAKAIYPKRPFMGPALRQVAPRLPEHWSGILYR
jgi:hypothetical protein